MTSWFSLSSLKLTNSPPALPPHRAVLAPSQRPRPHVLRLCRSSQAHSFVSTVGKEACTSRILQPSLWGDLLPHPHVSLSADSPGLASGTPSLCLSSLRTGLLFPPHPSMVSFPRLLPDVWPLRLSVRLCPSGWSADAFSLMGCQRVCCIGR